MIAGSACSGGDPAVSTTTPAPGDQPAVVVEQWLGAIAASDTEALERLVEPVGLAVLAGVENGLRSDELVALLDSGFDPELAIEYWDSFRRDFEAIRDLPLASLIVGDESDIAGQPDAVAVEIASPEGAGLVILRKSAVGGWQVDTAATMGPALIGPLADYLLSALDGANSEFIAAAYREGVVPGLNAAVGTDPENTDLAFETEFIRQLLQS
jgi:hypothetical protein